MWSGIIDNDANRLLTTRQIQYFAVDTDNQGKKYGPRAKQNRRRLPLPHISDHFGKIWGKNLQKSSCSLLQSDGSSTPDMG